MWVLWMVVVALTGPWILRGCSVPQPVIRDRCTVSSVHDGDTIHAECQGEKLKIRLYCIDAPEISQKPWGLDSRDNLRSLLPQGSVIQLKIYDKDKYGRQVAEVIKGNENLNQLMVQTGQVVVYPRYCPAGFTEYYQAEEQARQSRKGVWRKSGLQQQPWKWRHRYLR